MRFWFPTILVAIGLIAFKAEAVHADHLNISKVRFPTQERIGTIIVDTRSKHLYLVTGTNTALRYRVGVGREGFEWSGVSHVSRKAEWPAWRPPSEMLERHPDLPTYMPGGPENPLGARALYIGASLYRIHGTKSQWSIGRRVSSGCIRLLNDQVIDLYNRVEIGAKVIVQ